MDINNYKKLENKVKKKEFSEDYKGLNLLLKGLSIFGNFASIFLASYFLSSLLTVAIDNDIVTWIVTLTMLSGLELSKRVIFAKFSREFIRIKEVFKAKTLPLLVTSLILVGLSFYSSLNGAQKFSSKEDEIEIVAEEEVNVYADSITSLYTEKISRLEDQNQTLFEQNVSYDEKIAELPQNYITEKRRWRAEKEKNVEIIEDNKKEIESLKNEMNTKIKEYEKEINEDSSEKKGKNEQDIIIFILTSTLIEFLILTGIYFNKLYDFKSYKDFKKKLLSNPNYKKWFEFSEILELIYMNNEERDKIPDTSLIIELAELNKIYIDESDLSTAIKLFKTLGVIEESNNIKYLSKDKDDAHKALKNYFKIQN